MSELDLTITDFAQGDDQVRKALVEEISEHLNGLKPFAELSSRAQMIIEVWECSREHEESLHGGTMGYPVDDDDIPLQDEDI